MREKAGKEMKMYLMFQIRFSMLAFNFIYFNAFIIHKTTLYAALELLGFACKVRFSFQFCNLIVYMLLLCF
jgi:hypothetical protein